MALPRVLRAAGQLQAARGIFFYWLDLTQHLMAEGGARQQADLHVGIAEPRGSTRRSLLKIMIAGSAQELRARQWFVIELVSGLIMKALRTAIASSIDDTISWIA